MAEPLKILFATNSEHGQANAVMAVAHELLIRGDVSVHVASFAELNKFVVQANARAKKASATASALHFHIIEGESMAHAVGGVEASLEKLSHETGFRGAWGAYGRIPDVFMCWSGAQYMEQAHEVKRLYEEIGADLIVIDLNFNQAVDGAKLAGGTYMYLSPNAFKDIVVSMQPNGAMLWKYPPFGTAWPFPMRWWQIPLNVLLQIRLISMLFLHPKAKDVFKARKAAGIDAPLPLFDKHNVPYICPCRPEMDWPLYVPDNIHGCGPFLLPSEPVDQVDPELAAWIDHGPLILINRGSHMLVSDRSGRMISQAIRVLRKQRPDVRVLWKVKRTKDFNESTLDLIREDQDADMVRTVNWLAPDPLAILRTGKVICFVNHGGANSWYEGASAGVPQVIVPSWYDCHDWAVRSESLGVGVWGSRRAGLALDGNELGQALLRACEEPPSREESADTGKDASTPPNLVNAIEGDRSENLRINAQRLATQAGASGTSQAAKIILDYAAACREKRIGKSA